jgi:hypothetical protein
MYIDSIVLYSTMLTDTDINIQPYIWGEEAPQWDTDIYRLSQEEYARLQEGVPYVKVQRYNPKQLYPKLNGYGDNGERKVWFSCGGRTVPVQLTRYLYNAHVRP